MVHNWTWETSNDLRWLKSISWDAQKPRRSLTGILLLEKVRLLSQLVQTRHLRSEGCHPPMSNHHHHSGQCRKSELFWKTVQSVVVVVPDIGSQSRSFAEALQTWGSRNGHNFCSEGGDCLTEGDWHADWHNYPDCPSTDWYGSWQVLFGFQHFSSKCLEQLPIIVFWDFMNELLHCEHSSSCSRVLRFCRMNPYMNEIQTTCCELTGLMMR